MKSTLKVILTAVTLCVALPSVGFAKKESPKGHFDWKTEIESLRRVDLMPKYRSGQYVEQISSYDTTGGNNDGFNGTYSHIRKEGDNLVLADLKGPGVIERIWTPTPTEDTLAFYFDGEKEARLRVKFSDLFSGKVYPFVRPMSGNEIGGFYTYFPIPYENSCKVVFEGKGLRFHQIQYRNLPNLKVESYTPELAQSLKPSIDAVNEIWNNINPTVAQYSAGDSKQVMTKEERFVLNPGEEINFFDMNKGGRIVGFEIMAGAAFEGVYKDVMLKAAWDDESFDAINAPVADFFGYAYGKPAMRSIVMGRRADVNYCYLPAPFDRSAQMSLFYAIRDGVDQRPISVDVKVYYNNQARDEKTEGKLYTTWRRENPATNGAHYRFAELKGKGHYVGTVNVSQGLLPEMTAFFEGDDSTYVDGKMRLHGTGSEDYFNGGWYAVVDRWDRGVSLPIHGALDYNLPFSRTGGYRFYLSDKIPYENKIYMGIEHGPEGNIYPVDYTSVAFYYSADIPTEQVMIPTEALREIYMPTEFAFYPDLMSIIIGSFESNIRVSRHDGLRFETDNKGVVQIRLDDIPEGKYEIFMSYYKSPMGGDFAVLQRQNLIQEWKSASSETSQLVSREKAGEFVLTPQTNSLSIHVRKTATGDRFEIQRLFLKQIK